MTHEERIISAHCKSLSAHYGDVLTSMKFGKPEVINEIDKSGVESHSVTKKVRYITRHLLTSEVTHAIILDREWYER
jgi:hypothetical protein